MKLSKIFFLAIISILSVAMISSCKKKCKNDLPQARIINNGSSYASVQIKTSDGNTVNINNVAPGTSSSYASYAAGKITFNIAVNKSNYSQDVSAGYCTNYDIAIDNNGNITVNSTEKKYE
jgi:hypothetical protein